jgi:hypothetical protein
MGSGISFPVYARVPKDEAAYDAVTIALAVPHDYVITLEEKHRNRAALALCALNAMWNSKWRVKTDTIRKVAALFEKSERVCSGLFFRTQLRAACFSGSSQEIL